MRQPVDIAALISAADAAAHDRAGLRRLVRRSWPAVFDATRPAALEWVRRWGPVRLAAPRPDCACATGTCGWCN